MAQSMPEIRDLIGSRIERFVIQARLGSGGVGEVYLAHDSVLKRLVAIKAIRREHSQDPSFHRRLLREAERASQLNDERIARIYDVLESQSRAFLVMEYVQGETLRTRLGKPLPTDEFFHLAEECLNGVAAAHACGLLHCDLKPENIMITSAGQVKILDFGFACPLQSDNTQSSLTTNTTPRGGTLGYMAPEVLMGHPPHPGADIFSLGVILYEALTGLHPFRSDGSPTAARALTDAPHPIRRPVLAGLDALIFKMLARSPAERYQSCAEVLADLRSVREGRAPAALIQKPMAKSRPWRVRAVTAAAVVVLLFVSWPSPTPPPPPPGRLLAVLPFQPADPNDASTRALANGLTATLTARLGELAESYRLQSVPAPDLRAQHATGAREARDLLGATLALSGDLQPSGNTMRVTYSLVDTASLRQVQSAVITQESSNVFELQNRVFGEVLNSLDIQLAAEDQQRMKVRGSVQPGAYDAYLRGYGYLHVYDRDENVQNAIAAFQASIHLDPHFAPAYAGLGQAYLQEKTRTAEEITLARQACTRAVELDRASPDGEICLGMLLRNTGKYEEAVQHLQRAVQLDDRLDEPLRELAWAYESLKRLTEAETALKSAIAIRPQYWAGYKWLGKFYSSHGRLDESIEQFKQVIKLAPGNFSVYSNIGGIYAWQGKYAEAIPYLQQSIAIRPSRSALSNLGVASFYDGKYLEAAHAYQQALEMKPDDYIVVGNLAEAHAQIQGFQQQSAAEYERALTLTERELAVNPKDAVILSCAGLYAARLGQRDKAEQYRQSSLSLSANDPHIRENSALILAEFHQDDLALADLDRAVREGLDVFEITHKPAWQRFAVYPRYWEITARREKK